ncbi:hypothetical protein QF036_002680 [Arthrobacter globiformis]|nr:hypothetical protein [Arthrobacter globiformis]
MRLGPATAYGTFSRDDMDGYRWAAAQPTALGDDPGRWQTAAALFTHRQTIIYRIRKIGELTGLDMTETSTLAQLWFALQIHSAMPPPQKTPTQVVA